MKRILILVILMLSFTIAGAAYATESYPWRNHEAPYDYLFGNHIDTHQQSKLNGQEDQLGGFFYIKYTGGKFAGVPEAEHGSCDATSVDCTLTVGWKLKGVAVRATLVEKPHMGHPIWRIAAQDMPRSPGYSHFHWEGAPEHAGGLVVGQSYDGYLLKLTAVDRFFFKHHGGFLVTPGIDTETHANIVID